MLHTGRDQPISFSIRNSFDHFRELIVFEKPADLGADLCSYAGGRRYDHPLWKSFIRTPNVNGQDADLLVQCEIADDRFKFGYLAGILTTTLRKNERVIAFVQDLSHVTQRLSQRTGTLDRYERSEIIHVRPLIFRIEPIIGRCDSDGLVGSILSESFFYKARVQM